MQTRTRTASVHPHSHGQTVVEVWTSDHDAQPPYHVGTWAHSDSVEVADGAAMLADACDALGLAGRSLMGHLLRHLDADDRVALALAVVNVAELAAVAALTVEVPR